MAAHLGQAPALLPACGHTRGRRTPSGPAVRAVRPPGRRCRGCSVRVQAVPDIPFEEEGVRVGEGAPRRRGGPKLLLRHFAARHRWLAPPLRRLARLTGELAAALCRHTSRQRCSLVAAPHRPPAHWGLLSPAPPWQPLRACWRLETRLRAATPAARHPRPALTSLGGPAVAVGVGKVWPAFNAAWRLPSLTTVSPTDAPGPLPARPDCGGLPGAERKPGA